MERLSWYTSLAPPFVPPSWRAPLNSGTLRRACVVQNEVDVEFALSDASRPFLVRDLAAPRGDDAVIPVQREIDPRTISAEVRAAALLAGQRGGRHEAREGVRIREQAAQAGRVALEPG